LLAALVELGHRCGAVVSAHEDLEAVLATGADGVHLPGGADPAAARARFPDGLIGVSAHSPEEAAGLLRCGANYVTISPIFTTGSTPGYGPAPELARLAETAALASGPVVALGGITGENAGSCIAAGAAGVAVIGEVMRAGDPEAAVRALLRA